MFCDECGHDLREPKITPLKDLYLDEKIAKIQRYLPKGLTEKILSQRDKIEGERFATCLCYERQKQMYL